MYYQKINNSLFILNIKRGEKIIVCLKEFCLKLNLWSGFFYGLGALDEVILANYEIEKKKYREKEFYGSYELTNISGNIAFFGAEVVIHAHVTLVDERMNVIAGHLVEGRVSGTVELFLTTMPVKITKKYDERTGLKLMKLKEEV